jgi:hypothetical protein
VAKSITIGLSWSPAKAIEIGFDPSSRSFPHRGATIALEFVIATPIIWCSSASNEYLYPNRHGIPSGIVGGVLVCREDSARGRGRRHNRRTS